MNVWGTGDLASNLGDCAPLAVFIYSSLYLSLCDYPLLISDALARTHSPHPDEKDMW